MTKAFLPLLANNFKIMFGLSKDFKQRRRDIAVYVALSVLMLPILIIACIAAYYFSRNMTMDMVASAIASIMFLSEIIVMFFAVMSSISVLFFAKDTELLMALPVTGLDIFLSKLTTVYLLHLGLALLIQLPVVLVMGIGAAIKSAGFYILGILGIILTPFIPMFIISIIAVPLGYVISYFKRNNIIGTIIVLFLFGGFFAGYYYLIFAMQNTAQGGSLNMESIQSAMKIMSYIIYPNTYLANSMVTSGLEAFKNFGIFFAIIAGLAAISITISAFLYKGSARRGLESGSKGNGKVKDNQVQSPAQSLVLRDLKSCLGETSGAINYLMGLVIVPIVMIMMSLIYGGDNQPGGSAPVITIAVSLAMVFGCGMNYFAIVAFSREGRQMDVLKMLPVPDKMVVNQKIALASLYTLLMTLVLIFSMFIAKVHYVIVIMTVLSVFIAGNAVNVIVINFDLKSPNFVWNTNKELFKNNSKSLASLVLALPLLLVSVISVICFGAIWPDLFGDNISLNYFISMLPTLGCSLLYALFAAVCVYPKMLQKYECLEI